MRKWYLILSLFLLAGCGQTAYNPHYIVSDTLDEDLTLQEPDITP